MSHPIDPESPFPSPNEEETTPPAVPFNTYEAKQAARRARLEVAAERAHQRAEQHFTRAHDALAGIEPGQPILVGHHSERRHRNALARHDTQMRRGIDAEKATEELAHRAAAVGTGGISSDDPEAIEKLRVKVTALTEGRDRMKVLNALFRKQKTLHDHDFQSPTERDAVLRNLRYHQDRPYPAYVLQNIGARIRDAERRIEALQARATFQAAEPEHVGESTIIQDVDDNRVLLTFPQRLSKEDYRTVRAFGFVWSPTRKAFVRKLNRAAVFAARDVARRLAQNANPQAGIDTTSGPDIPRDDGVSDA